MHAADVTETLRLNLLARVCCVLSGWPMVDQRADTLSDHNTEATCALHGLDAACMYFLQYNGVEQPTVLQFA